MIKSSPAKPTWRPATTEPAGATVDVERIRTGAADVDACAYLFRFCRDLEGRYRDRGLDFLFDVEPAKLPEIVCRAIALMARAVVETAPSHARGGTVTLTLQRRDTAYAAVITVRRLHDDGAIADRGLASVRMLAARLGAECRIRATADSRVVVVLFEPHAAGARRSTGFRSIDAPPSSFSRLH
jgi:hypothetical protein